MDTRKIGIAIALFAIALTGCQKELSQTPDPKEMMIDFTATAEIDHDTKTAIEHIATGGYKPFWLTGDKLGFYTEVNGQESSHNGQITVETVNADGSATLKGQATAGTHTFYAYYPYENDNDKPEPGTDGTQLPGNLVDNVKVQIFACQMPGKDTFDGKSDILCAAPVENVTIEEGKPANVNFNFKRLSTVMRLNITGIDLNTVTKVSIISKNLKLSGSASLNLKTGKISHDNTHKKHNIISAVYTKGALTTGDGVFINMWPVTFDADNSLRIKVEGIDGQNNAYAAIKDLSFKKAKTLETGKVYNVPVEFQTGEIKTIPAPLFYETFDKTIISGSADWDGAQFRTDASTAVYSMNTPSVKAIRTLPNSDAFIESSSGNNFQINKGKYLDITGISIGKRTDLAIDISSMNGKLDVELYTGQYSDGAIYKIANFNNYTVSGEAIQTSMNIRLVESTADKNINIRLTANGSAVRIDDIKVRAPKNLKPEDINHTVAFTTFGKVYAVSNGNTIQVEADVNNYPTGAACGIWYKQGNNAIAKKQGQFIVDQDAPSISGSISELTEGIYTIGAYVTVGSKDYLSEGIVKTVSPNTKDLNENSFVISKRFKSNQLAGPGKLATFNGYQGFRAGKLNEKTNNTTLTLDTNHFGSLTGNVTLEFYAGYYTAGVPGAIQIEIQGAGNVDPQSITLSGIPGTEGKIKDDYTGIDTANLHHKLSLTGVTKDTKIIITLKKKDVNSNFPTMGMWGLRFSQTTPAK